MTVLSPKLLAEGQVASSEGAIYTAPASTSTYLKTITFSNSSAISQTLIVYIRNGAGTSRVIGRATLLQNWRYEFDGAMVLETGDSLRATTTTANVIDYTVHGVEQV